MKLILQQIPIFVQFVNSFVFKFDFNKFPFKNELKLLNFDTSNLRRVEHCVHKIIYPSNFDEYSHWHFSENFFISVNKWDIGTAFSKEIKLWFMHFWQIFYHFLLSGIIIHQTSGLISHQPLIDSILLGLTTCGKGYQVPMPF